MKRIAIQGLRGSFHHEAALHYFGDQITLEECETFPEVSAHVLSATADYGLMAIENSLAGSIIPNYALLRKDGLTIIGEIVLRVKMNLMVYNGASIRDIKEVHSHQMAIRQCSSFFHKHPSMKIVEAFDTAGSAQYIKENQLQHVAAIASSMAAKTYDLTILQTEIENQQSFTRFLVLSQGQRRNETDLNKASLYLEAAHRPGSLAEILTLISSQDINLSKLQSHPVSGQDRTYGFFIDLEFAALSQFHQILDELRGIAEVLNVLGIYKRGGTYE